MMRRVCPISRKRPELAPAEIARNSTLKEDAAVKTLFEFSKKILNTKKVPKNVAAVEDAVRC